MSTGFTFLTTYHNRLLERSHSLFLVHTTYADCRSEIKMFNLTAFDGNRGSTALFKDTCALLLSTFFVFSWRINEQLIFCSQWFWTCSNAVGVACDWLHSIPDSWFGLRPGSPSIPSPRIRELAPDSSGQDAELLVDWLPVGSRCTSQIRIQITSTVFRRGGRLERPKEID